MRSLTFTLCAGAVLSTIATHANAYEEPKHTVREQVGAIEIRDYQPSIVAEVEVSGDRKEASNKGFRLLAGYIFGGNRLTHDIAMTVPVTQTEKRTGESIKIAMTTPVTQTQTRASSANEPVWRVTFTMPSEFSMAALPTPNDARVKLTQEPSKKIVAIRFSGSATARNLENHRTQLEAFVTTRGYKSLGSYTLALYDDPMTLPWNRRNEWWVTIEQ